MIDDVARTKAAQLARQLANAHITNYRFEDAQPKSKDWSIQEVYFRGLWPLYDDLHEHKLNGKWRLTSQDRKWVARLVLFLKSGTAYRWPRTTGLAHLPISLLSLVTLGAFGWFWHWRTSRHGDKSVWPFFTRGEYEQALQRPVYLAGSLAQQGVAPEKPAFASLRRFFR